MAMECVVIGWGSSSGGCPSFFPIVLDEFTIHRPKGNHCCLVTEVQGPSLRSLQERPNGEVYALPLAVEKK